ncbi:prepilin-type N-terminal cleavage/methylation domain-containing protein [Thioalkalivibrio sp. ALE11]|uniref:prepilin-type N-terminal cleavage/methylation domain-containing protein n=1 Tax=Thioalkalivibrio sp. ALE11 TaxID=1265494 RepID=UPI0012DD5D72|nr:prepilin-type N-terminal cleavage/methylation domain-containing protein [Thioalkalivibrio sp. ALE11]
MPGRVSARGFTLMEVLIALVLLSLIMTALFSALRLGVSSWDAAERSVAETAEEELALRLLDRQLALAMPLMLERDGEQARIAFEGEPNRVRWASPLPAHRGGGGIQWQTLELGETARGEGLVLRFRLLHPDTLEAPADQVEDTELLLAGIDAMELSYYGRSNLDEEAEWFSEWSVRDRLPDLVTLTLQSDRGSQTSIYLSVAPRQAKPTPQFDIGPHR